MQWGFPQIHFWGQCLAVCPCPAVCNQYFILGTDVVSAPSMHQWGWVGSVQPVTTVPDHPGRAQGEHHGLGGRRIGCWVRCQLCALNQSFACNLSLLVPTCKPENLILRAMPVLPLVSVLLCQSKHLLQDWRREQCLGYPRCRQGVRGTRQPQGWDLAPAASAGRDAEPEKWISTTEMHSHERPDSSSEGYEDAGFEERQLQSATPALCLFPHLRASSTFKGGRTSPTLCVLLWFVCFLSSGAASLLCRLV